jgi:hypothetical protein
MFDLSLAFFELDEDSSELLMLLLKSSELELSELMLRSSEAFSCFGLDARLEHSLTEFMFCLAFSPLELSDRLLK